MIVVDTQIIAYATLPGPYSDLAAGILARDTDWSAPLLWRSEYLNVMAGEMRRGSFGISDAVGYVTDATALIASELEPDANAVLALIANSPCTAYDLEFVAVAHAFGVPLVTNDRQILDSFPGIAVSLESFAGGSA